MCITANEYLSACEEVVVVERNKQDPLSSSCWLVNCTCLQKNTRTEKKVIQNNNQTNKLDKIYCHSQFMKVNSSTKTWPAIMRLWF